MIKKLSSWRSDQMITNSNTPKIRFKNFSEDWVQKKLVDEVIFFSGLTYTPSDVVDKSGTLVLRSSNVQNGAIALGDNVYVKSEVVNSQNVEVGDSIVVVRNGSRNLIGKHAMITKPMDNTVIGAFMTGIRAPVPSFFNTLLDTQEFHDEVSKNLGATINQITGGMFKAMSFYLPESDEQTAIDNLFQNIDQTIALQRRKHEQTQTLKKSLLSKMFPQKEQRQPDIRLKSFSGDWVETTLEGFGSSIGGTSLESEFLRRGKYKVISIGSYSENSKYTDQGIRVTKNEKTSKKLLCKNDLTMILNDKTLAGNIIGRVLLIDEDERYVFNQRTQRMIINQEKYIPQFLYHMLNADEIRRKIVMSSQGNTQIYVNWSSIKKLIYLTPSSIKEQTAIGEFFEKIDEAIALQAKQLSILENIKKALLAKVFV